MTAPSRRNDRISGRSMIQRTTAQPSQNGSGLISCIEKEVPSFSFDSSILIDPIISPLSPFEITIPGDPSSAAFFAAAAAMIPNSDLTLKKI